MKITMVFVGNGMSDDMRVEGRVTDRDYPSSFVNPQITYVKEWSKRPVPTEIPGTPRVGASTCWFRSLYHSTSS